MNTATEYLKTKYPHQHTFPFSQVAEELELFWKLKKDAYEKARKEFNSEQWQANHNIEEIRKRLKDGK